MTQVGKRRREGIVEPPDLDGIYAGEQSVKRRRRMGIVQPPVYEQLQLPESLSATNLNDREERDESPAAGDEKSSNGVEVEEKEAIKAIE